ncbi:MAG: DUF2723 domain-containing protein [Cyclobacteriaceae bacterium]
MQDYKKVNVITGWIMFLIAAVVYFLTVEPTASFWDCGEFIAVSYKLEVPHPPGAPLFLLIGRLFSFLALNNTEQVAFMINMVSVLSSAFTILFLFWSVTHLAKKFFSVTLSGADTLAIMGAGSVAALAYTFSDSFWFSAVEAEVYAMSSFFTAFVVWAILKWENIEDEADRNKWMVLIAFMMGLSIGVHLLNLVTIPALGLIVLYKYREQISTKGIVTTMIASGAIILVIMYGVIPGLPSIAGSFEIFFVNSLGMPFGSGAATFAFLFLGAVVYGVYYTQKKGLVLQNTVMLSFAFVLIGYSIYSMVLIRSAYNPPIDENDPENALSFVSYLKREQYGSRPLVHGQYYTAQIVEQKKGEPILRKGEDEYEITDYKVDYVYDPQHTTILPRMYSSAGSHVQRYREITGLKQGEKPTFVDNLAYMFKHQLGHMYMRYFLWNFAGRESDIQNADWMSINDAFKEVPSELANNKGRNNYFMIPLLLGIIGLFYQYRKDGKNFAVVALLFFLTGAALVLYLNSPPVEPRERDYIYAGSYYAFAFWIGFSVLAFYDLLKKAMKGAAAPAIAIVLCLSAPVIMAIENWDDHDRSDRYFSVDSAKNFLASCAPNAIIFTGGDNDTFPLWYAQEVEGFRTDVRVVVLSYFNTDWYIEQMTRQAYESDPLPFTLGLEDYIQGGPNDYLPVVENPSVKGAINVKQYLKLLKDNHPALLVPTSISSYNSVPAKSMFMAVDTADVLSKGIIPADMQKYMTSRMSWNIKGSGLEKKDLAIIDFIASNNWERPIYFNNTSLAGVNVDLRKYVVQEGTAYRLLPIENPDPSQLLVNADIMYDNLMNNFYWRELDNPDVYYSEDYRNFVLNHRATFNTLATELMAKNRYSEAREALLKCIELIPDESIRFDHFTVQQVGMLLRVGEEDLANQIAELTSARADEMLTYLFENDINDTYAIQRNLISLNELSRAFNSVGETEKATEYQQIFRKHYGVSQQ